MKHKILKLSALLILPFVFLGCTYYQGLNELKAKIKPNELDVTVVDAKFTNVKRSIIANTPRCFSSMYNVSGDCTIHTNNSKILEVSCSRKMKDSYLGSSKVNVLVPYIKAEKVDSQRTKLTIYSGHASIINTIVVEWAKGEHQMCPSIL